MTEFERRANDVDVGLLVVCEAEQNTSAVPVERNKDTLDIMRGERQGTKGDKRGQSCATFLHWEDLFR